MHFLSLFINKKTQSLLNIFFCNRGDTIQYHSGLQSRELGQAPMLLVFLLPMIFVGVHEFSSRLTTF